MTVSVASISFHDNYIDVVLEGVSVGFSPQFLTIHDQAFAAAEEHSCSNILIDASAVEYTIDTIMERNVAIDLAHRCQGIYRVALISPSPEHGAYKQVELTAHGRGIDVRVFARREEAVVWLLH